MRRLACLSSRIRLLDITLTHVGILLVLPFSLVGLLLSLNQTLYLCR